MFSVLDEVSCYEADMEGDWMRHVLLVGERSRVDFDFQAQILS